MFVNHIRLESFQTLLLDRGTHGRRLFSKEGGGENASKIVMPLKMALGEGILFALLVEG